MMSKTNNKINRSANLSLPSLIIYSKTLMEKLAQIVIIYAFSSFRSVIPFRIHSAFYQLLFEQLRFMMSCHLIFLVSCTDRLLSLSLSISSFRLDCEVYRFMFFGVFFYNFLFVSRYCIYVYIDIYKYIFTFIRLHVC